MNEHTADILARFSPREWQRVQALGFPVPPRGQIAIANYLARPVHREPDVAERPPVEHLHCVPVLLTRGAIRLRATSMRSAAARLGVPYSAVRGCVRSDVTVNGWRVRRAAA